VPGSFDCDVFKVLDVEHKLQNMSPDCYNAEELLAKINVLINGRFLEGCAECSEDSFVAVSALQARVDHGAILLLARYCDLLSSQHLYPLAYAVARKIVQMAPGEYRAVLRAVELAQQAGITGLKNSLGASTAHIVRAERALKKRTPCVQMVEAEPDTYSEFSASSAQDKHALATLCCVPFDFQFDLAKKIVGVSRKRLADLHQRGLLTTATDGLYRVAPALQRVGVLTLSAASQDRFFVRICCALEDWLVLRCSEGKLSAPYFMSDDRARHAIKLTAVAGMAHKPSLSFINMVMRASRQGYYSDIATFRDWAEKVADSTADQYLCGSIWIECAMLDFRSHEFVRAAALFERALGMFTEEQVEYSQVLAMLPLALHHASQTDQALYFNLRQIQRASSSGSTEEEAGAIRFRAEMLRSVGRMSEAMECLRESIRLYSTFNAPPLALAECNYQLAASLLAEERLDEALHYIGSAYEIRKTHSDYTGMGQCAVQLATIAVARKCSTEAMAHIDFALHLFKSANKAPSYAAALITRGDILRHLGKYEASLQDYEEALAYWRGQGHEGWIQTCLEKLQALRHQDGTAA
jgi:tetratricopeptide (TPR) repeat protein